MTLSTRAVEIIRQLHAKFPALANGEDDERRALTLMMAEQIRFELGTGWGTKKAGPANPQSKDAIAYTLNEHDELAPMDVWDWQAGASREPMVQPGDAPTYPGLTGQRFIRVKPVDHLGVATTPAPTPVPPAPVPQPPAVDLGTVLQRIDTLEDGTDALFAELFRRLDALKVDVNADRKVTGRQSGWAGGSISGTVTKG